MLLVVYLTRKIVSEMTYNVSNGMLNPTMLYYTRTITKMSSQIVPAVTPSEYK